MASYEKLNDKWHVRFYVNGKQKHLSGFGTKREAENAFLLFPKDKIIEERKLPAFNEIFLQYKSHKTGRIKESSLQSYQSSFDLHYKKFLNYRIDQIKEIHIMEWHRELEAKKLSFRTKQKLHAQLVSIFRFAKKVYKIENVASEVGGFKNNEIKKEMLFWTKEEFEKFSKEIDNQIYKTFFMFLFYMGTRKGEALALRWEDIDFTKKTCRINKTYSRKTTDGSKYKITPPKTITSNRILLMPDILLKQIELLKEEYRKKIKLEIKQDWYIFGLDKPICESAFEKVKTKYANKAGVKQIRIHDLRHSHASHLLSLGSNIMLIAKRLGHADIKETLNTYSHLMPNLESEIIAKL